MSQMSRREEFTCSMCGGRYFRASLPHHQKVCASRHNVPIHFCEYCNLPVPAPELEIHLLYRCEKAPRGKEQSRLKAADADSSLLDGREACSCCHRRFLRARLPTHESICVKIAAKGSRKPFNSFKQRAIEGSVPVNVETKNLKTLIIEIKKQGDSRKPPGVVIKMAPRLNSEVVKGIGVAQSSSYLATLRQWNNQPLSVHPGSKNSPRTHSRLKSRYNSETPTGSKIVVAARPAPLARPTRITVAPVRTRGRKLNSEFGKDPLLITGSRLNNQLEPGSRMLQSQKGKIIPSNTSSPDNPLVTGWGM